MSNRKKATGKPSKPSLLHLPATREQVAQLLEAHQDVVAARERLSLIFTAYMASQGRTTGQLVEIRGGEHPQVIVQEAENTGQTQPSRSRS